MRDLSTLLPWLRDPDPEPETDPLTAAYEDGKAHAEAKVRRTLTSFAVTDAATGRLHDPSDAPAFVDLDTLDPDDPVGIDAAITDLLSERPHLGLPPEPAPVESGDQWLRQGWAPNLSPGARRLLGR